ncbi:AAA family ATPase [Aquabacterium sp.]|uniref:AAA family ATPase n=1 Tax=Aquabacterium sp. TaxID=1872578 RepID=UPI004038086F
MSQQSGQMASMTDWLAAIGLSRLEPVLRDNGIAEDILTSLTEDDLEKLGVSMGDRKRFMRAIGELQVQPVPSGASSPSSPSSPSSSPSAPLPHTELRQLTIMFCDLVDATALCARLTPEQWRQVVLGYQQAAVEVISRCGGSVAQYLGDGLLVYFGYPQAQEDAASRAVHAGLDLVHKIASLELVIDGHEQVRLQVRIGIDTGRVVIGDIGAGPRREQLALGDTPNIAARLQALARANTVLISDQTRRLTAGSFTYEDQGVHVLKGVIEPRQVWRVTGLSDSASRFDASSGEHLSPLVGRVQELSLLNDRWQTVLQGQGQVVVLSGEPGIGKSRMLKELGDRLGNAGLHALQLQCAPHKTDSAFHPFVDALERMLRFKPDTPASVKLDRIDALMRSELEPEQARRQAALLAAMLSVPSDGRHDLPITSAHQREQDIIDVLLDWLEGRAAAEPALLLFEDAHWADPASVAALNKLVERARHLPVLLVVTHRPEFTPAFDRQAHVTALKVPGLRRAEVATLVSRLMGDRPLPQALADQIENRTDGVPLFVEELTKSVLEQASHASAVQADGALPATLRDSLMARLDRHAQAKEVAQIGAVIGRAFSRDLLSALFAQDEQQMEEGVQALLRSGLATRQESEQGEVYVFKHALVQDTAYDSLLKARREALHSTVLQVLESRYPETVQHQPALLARHAVAAGHPRAAIPYWKKASEQALHRLALHEAAAHLQAGLHTTQTLPVNAERDQIELQLHASLGTVHMLGKGWAAPEVEQAYKRANELASAADKVDEAIWPLWGVCVYHQVHGEIRQAQAIGRRMATVARQSNSRLAWLVNNMMQSQLAFYSGQLPQVGALCEQVEHGFHDPHDRSLIALYSTDLKLVAMVHGLHASWIMGQVDDVDQVYGLIEQRAIELEHPYSLAWARTWGVMVYLHAGELDRLLPRLQAGWHMADEHGFAYVSAMARFAMGWCRTQLGQMDDGIALMEQGLSAFQATGAGIVLPFFLAQMAEVLGRVGRHAEALACLDQAWVQTERGGERWHEAELHRIRGHLLQHAPQADLLQARACYQKAIEVAQQQQAAVWLQRAQQALSSLP